MQFDGTNAQEMAIWITEAGGHAVLWHLGRQEFLVEYNPDLPPDMVEEDEWVVLSGSGWDILTDSTFKERYKAA